MSQSLGEAVLTLKVDDKDYKKNIDDSKKTTDDLKKSSGEMEKEVDRDWKEIGAGIVEAATVAIEITKELIGKWAEAERAQTQLNFAVQSSPVLKGDAIGDLNAFAEAMKEISGVDDDVIKAQLAIEASFGLTRDQMKEVMTAALNLSSTGMVSLDQAVRGLSGSYEGQVGLLGRYVPQLRDLTKEQLAAGDAVKLINEKFGGMAEVLGGTLSGQLAKLHNAWEDLLKQAGRVLALDFKPLLKPFTDLLNAIANDTKATLDLKDAMDAWKKGSATYDQQILVLNAHYDALNQQYQNAISNLRLAQRENDTILKQRQAEITAIRDQMDATVKQIAKTNDAHYAEEQRAKDAEKRAKAALDAQQKAIDTANTALKQSQAIVEAYDAEKKAQADAEEAKRKELEETAKLVRQGIDNAAAAKKAYQDAQNAVTKVILNQLEASQKALDEQLASYADYVSAQEAFSRRFEKAWKGSIAAIIDAFSSVFSDMGKQLVDGTLSWNSFGTSVIHAIGKIVSALGDQLAAMAAADLIKAIAYTVSANPLAAGAYSAAAIEAAGAAAAWLAGGALQAIQLAEGGTFTVPPGYPNDTFTAGLTSGEKVTVEPVGSDESGTPLDIKVVFDGSVIARWLGKVTKRRGVILHAEAIR